jgi:hypothetical protein
MSMGSPFSRRTVLRGAGVALALPWLESLAPRPARGQTATPPRAFIAMTFPEGVAQRWKPATTGAGDAWALSPIMQPLAPIKPFINVLQNVGNYGPFGGHVEPSNSNLNGALLTCTKPKPNVPTTGAVTTSISVDQVIAQALTGRTSIDSLQVGLSTLDSYTDGLPAACSRSISWGSAAQPLFKNINPQSVFDQIVMAGGAGAAPGGSPLGADRRAKNKSILDYVTSHATTVRGRLGASDRTLMDQFLSSVRTLETSIQANPMCMVGQRPAQAISVNQAYPAGWDRDRHANIMIDLVVMAISCDATRVGSFMLDDARSDFVYNFLTTRKFSMTGSMPGTEPVGGYYGQTHAGDQNDGLATITWWNMAQLNALITKISGVKEGAGTAFDNTLIYAGSGLHGGNHDALNVPVVVAGTGGGVFKTGQALHLAGGSTVTGNKSELGKNMQDVHLTILNKVFGGAQKEFGVSLGNDPSQGVLTELLA